MTEDEKTDAISKLLSEFGDFCARTFDVEAIRREGSRVRAAMRDIDPSIPSDDDCKNKSVTEPISHDEWERMIDRNIEELVILRMGVLLSPPISVPRGTQQWRIGVSQRIQFASYDEMMRRLPNGPTECAVSFAQQSPEFLQIGDMTYRVLDYVV